MIGATIQFSHNCKRNAFGSLPERCIIEMDVAVSRASAPVSEQTSRDMQALAVHDRVRGVRMAQVMQPRVGYDSGDVACPDPERVEGMFGQRLVPVLAGEYPFPGSGIGDAIQQLARCFTE